MKDAGIDYSCSGAWINEGSTSDLNGNVHHELWHSVLTNILCIKDDSQGSPTNDHAQLSGISLAELTDAFTIFGQSVNSDCLTNSGTCPNANAGRPMGFTLSPDNYSMSSRQLAFIYALDYYIRRGPQFRVWIQNDLAAGDNLLESKYNWIRNSMFQGVEF